MFLIIFEEFYMLLLNATRRQIYLVVCDFTKCLCKFWKITD
uniref:Uncharacterized protein n=1 Tax=Aquilaria malaccensis TaxID=223753 RepID=A0A4Y6GLL7_9ROSI|nr:hypothetical protein [Aquilaria malaccensis]